MTVLPESYLFNRSEGMNCILLQILLLLVSTSNLLPRNQRRGWYRTQISAKSNLDFCKIHCQGSVAQRGAEHTMCLFSDEKPGAACANYENATTDAFRKSIVEAHNAYRDRIARGIALTGWPKSCKMRKMNWDVTLENIAQRWAMQCLEGHDKCRDVAQYPVGQNIFRKIGPAGEMPRAEDIVANWTANFGLFPVFDVDKYGDSLRDLVETEAFTQVIWGRTYNLGCSVAAQSNRTIFTVVCNYGPKGNVLGAPVFHRGFPCSTCPGMCDKIYLGLCLRERDHNNDTIRSSSNLVTQKEKKKTNSTPRGFFTLESAEEDYPDVFCDAPKTFFETLFMLLLMAIGLRNWHFL